jgi:hypothetical protein
MDLEIKFANSAQRSFYYATARNQCFSGGFNNGKTYAGALKAFTLLTTFNNYRMAICRQVYADLKRTTMQTFFKICPHEIIERHNEQDGLTVLKNRSQINWMHLDKVDENSLRGLEVNSILVDQAEETEEKVYDVLDARIGRWDNVEIPEALLRRFPNWPHSRQGKPLAPSYMMLLVNPDTQYHYIFRKYHPDSLEKNERYFFVEGEWDPTLGSEESYNEAIKRDTEWVNKYVKGQWGISNAQIHRVLPESFLEYSPELIQRIKTKGNLFRSLDHGDAAPTCCLWFAVLDGVYVCYREYYLGNEVISNHRRNIHDLSENEVYSGNYADPQIFKKTGQKDGGFWRTADEYMDKSIPGPALFWIPADNNEFATRNRINELLRPSESRKHPITGESPAPGLYFIKRSHEYQSGAYQSITQLQSQRRKLLGYVDGKSIYCDERDEGVTDHAYDPIRYFVAQHGMGLSPAQRTPPRMSLKFYQFLKKRQEQVTAASV